VEKVRGIILRRSDIKEVDRLLVLYTAERGRISVIAKGSRKITAKLMPKLELFNLAEIEFVRGKSLDTIVGVEVLSEFEGIKSDLRKVFFAHYMAEFILRLLKDEEKDERVFEILEKAFLKIDQSGLLESELYLRVFELGILNSLGYCPELVSCVRCANELLEEDNLFWAWEGGMVCPACAQRRGLKVDPLTLKLLRVFLAGDFDLVGRLKIQKECVLAARKILEDYVKYVAEKDFKSYKMLKKMCFGIELS
jgi:DNA repair protein RecO (recombination protein O)